MIQKNPNFIKTVQRFKKKYSGKSMHLIYSLYCLNSHPQMTVFLIFSTEHDFNSGTVIHTQSIRHLATDTVRGTTCWFHCNDVVHELMCNKKVKESEFRNSILGDTEEPVQLQAFTITVVSGRRELMPLELSHQAHMFCFTHALRMPEDEACRSLLWFNSV